MSSISRYFQRSGSLASFLRCSSSFGGNNPLERVRAACLLISRLSLRCQGLDGYKGKRRSFSSGIKGYRPPLLRSIVGHYDCSREAIILKNLSKEFGPIVLGLALEGLGAGILKRSLPMEHLHGCLRAACRQAQDDLAQIVMAGFQKELFDVANDPHKLWSSKHPYVSMMQKVYDQYPFESSNLHNPTIFVQSEVGVGEVCELDWARLEQRLKYIHTKGVHASLCSSMPLQYRATDVLDLIKHGLMTFPSLFQRVYFKGKIGVYLQEEELLQLIILGMLCLGKAPTNPSGLFPCTGYFKLEQLDRALSGLPSIEDKGDERIIPAFAGFPGEDKPIYYDCEGCDISMSIEYQQQLVRACENLNRIFFKLMR